MLYVVVGPLRASLSDSTSPQSTVRHLVVRGALSRSPWTSVLLTNLGSAYFYTMGDIEYLYGKTYKEYLLSLPPGFVSQLLHYERPLERWQGPNYWFRGISRGGIHPVVVPFHNFGIWGVLSIMGIIGVVIVWVDNPTMSAWRRFLFAGVTAIAFKWFWYGDMSLIRSIMGVTLLWALYVVLVISRRSSPVVARPVWPTRAKHRGS